MRHKGRTPQRGGGAGPFPHARSRVLTWMGGRFSSSRSPSSLPRSPAGLAPLPRCSVRRDRCSCFGNAAGNSALAFIQAQLRALSNPVPAGQSSCCAAAAQHAGEAPSCRCCRCHCVTSCPPRLRAPSLQPASAILPGCGATGQSYPLTTDWPRNKRSSSSRWALGVFGSNDKRKGGGADVETGERRS